MITAIGFSGREDLSRDSPPYQPKHGDAGSRRSVKKHDNRPCEEKDTRPLRTMTSTDPHRSASSDSHTVESVVLRNTLRYTISEDEYKALHRYLIIRSPKAVRRKALSPSKYSAITKSNDDFNASAVRASLRVLIGSQAGLTFWDILNEYLFARKKRK